MTSTLWRLVTVAGAVYRPDAEIVPMGALSDHVTAVLLVPVTVAANCRVFPAFSKAALGVTDTVIADEVGFTVIVARADRLGSATDVAIMLTVC